MSVINPQIAEFDTNLYNNLIRHETACYTTNRFDYAPGTPDAEGIYAPIFTQISDAIIAYFASWSSAANKQPIFSALSIVNGYTSLVMTYSIASIQLLETCTPSKALKLGGYAQIIINSPSTHFDDYEDPNWGNPGGGLPPIHPNSEALINSAGNWVNDDKDALETMQSFSDVISVMQVFNINTMMDKDPPVPTANPSREIIIDYVQNNLGWRKYLLASGLATIIDGKLVVA
jgi:hypothetical protein